MSGLLPVPDRQTVQRLAAFGYDWHNIMHMIAAVVSDDVYHVLKEDRRFDPGGCTSCPVTGRNRN